MWAMSFNSLGSIRWQLQKRCLNEWFLLSTLLSCWLQRQTCRLLPNIIVFSHCHWMRKVVKKAQTFPFDILCVLYLVVSAPSPSWKCHYGSDMESVFLNHSVCSGWPDWIDLAGCFSVGMLIKCNRFKATAPNKCFCGNHRSSPFNSLHFLSSAGGLCIWLLLREGTPIILSRSMWSIYIKILLFLFETLSHLFPPKINKVCRDYSSSVLKWYVWAVGAAVVLVGYIHSLKLWKCALEISASFWPIYHSPSRVSPLSSEK